MNFLTILGLFSLAASAATIYAVFTAKAGYEDESGFHFGIPHSTRVRPSHPPARLPKYALSLSARVVETSAPKESIERLAHV